LTTIYILLRLISVLMFGGKALSGMDG